MDKNNISHGNVFSSERFAKLIKYDFAVRKSNYLKLLIVALGVFVGMSVLIGIPAMSNINEMKTNPNFNSYMLAIRQQSAWYSYAGIGLWILCIGLTIMGSLTFGSMSQKKDRITTLMVPASVFEKYLLNFIIYFVGGIIALLVGFLLGALTLQLAIGGGSVMTDSLFDFMHQVDYSWLVMTIFVLLALLGNSLYALGSALWPRLSWLKTWIVVAVIEWVVAVPVMMVLFSGFNFQIFFNLFGDGVPLLWGVFSLLLILNIACWAGAWYRFRNTQIVQRFMKK